MSVTQYIGARYVPLFADPLTWDITKAYEALTIVYYQGNSFTSRQAVPAGIDITNDAYWALTGNYNAQIEQYRAEVQAYDGRISANTASNTAQDAQLAGTSSSGLKTLIDANTASNTAQDAQLAGTSESGLKTLIDANTSSNTAQDAQLAGTSGSGLKTLIDANTATNVTQGQAIAAIQAQIAEKQYFGVIGDSFSNEEGEWPTILGNMLGLTPVSVAVGSTGFVAGGNNKFLNQLTTLHNNAHWADLAFVIVYGGTNDYTVESATQSQMRDAFSLFKSSYEGYTDAPPLIFAFGNVGNPNRSVYNGIGEWYSRLCNWLKANNMPGFVDNVIFWLFPYNLSDVIGTDGVHPTLTGHKVIASYFEEVIRGCYCGVRGEEVIVSSDETARTILTFVNGQWTAATKFTATPVTINQFKNVGSAQHCYAFGTLGQAGNPEVVRGIVENSVNFTNQVWYTQYVAFNPLNKNMYARVTGSSSIGDTTITGVGSVAGNCL